MRVAICDDTPADREALAAMCRQFATRQALNITIDEYGDGEGLLANMVGRPYAIVMLDIYMDHSNGIETARALRRQGFDGALFFVTSSREFYPESYEVNALHYLVKPFNFNDFSEAMKRALHHCGLNRHAPGLLLTVDRQKVEVPLDVICYIEVYNHTVYVHTTGRKLQTSTSLSSLKKSLNDHRFLQCHRSYVVNMDHIDYIDEAAAKIVMDNGDEIPVSRREKSSIKKDYIRYICGNAIDPA